MDQEDRQWIKELPNQLTMFRIAVAPIILFLYPMGIHSLKILCAVLFTLACITDILDGYIARTYQVESKLGALIDPLADKILTGVGLLLIAHSGAVWVWMAGLILARELGIMGLRLVATQEGIVIRVNAFGKAKAIALDFAIGCLLVNYPLFGLPFKEFGMICIWVALGLSLYSGWLYGQEFWRRSNEV